MKLQLENKKIKKLQRELTVQYDINFNFKIINKKLLKANKRMKYFSLKHF